MLNKENILDLMNKDCLECILRYFLLLIYKVSKLSTFYKTSSGNFIDFVQIFFE